MPVRLFVLCALTNTTQIPPADTTTVSVCSRCGVIERSGRTSCCGHGGSWFRNCGSSGNTKVHHTWHEGIQTCKARSQSKIRIDQQLNAIQQKIIDSANGADMANYKTSPNVPIGISMSHTSAGMSISTQGCAKLWNIVVHITPLLSILDLS